jgi:signal transduction histidine kinase
MVSLSAAMILTMLAFNLYSERVLFSTLEERTRGLIESIRLAMGEITKQDEEQGPNVLEQFTGGDARGIREINIIDAAARITGSTNPDKVGTAASPTITELIFQSESGRLVTKRQQGYHVVIPVVAKGEHQGYIHLVLSTEDIVNVLESHTREWVVATVVILGLGIVAAIWLSAHYTRPMRELAASAKSVAAGDLDVSLDVTERDEVGEVKESFNQMIQKLSELRDLEGRLREAEHLSTVGELARTVAHEIRNPLNFISLSVDHLMDRTTADDVQELLRNIKHEIRRLESLVRNFLTHGKPLRVTRCPVRAVALVEQTLALVNARAERFGVDIVRAYRLDPDTVISADPELLKSCLFNAFQNAFQAMPDGGTLTITLEKEADCVVVTITDTGEGLEEEFVDKVFEAFFTTRERGLGLGLAMTKRVIEGHGGTVGFTSIPGTGSTVTYRLPVQPIT